MVAYTMPQHRKKKESENLYGYYLLFLLNTGTNPGPIVNGALGRSFCI